MLKKHLLLAAGAMLATGALAATVSPQQALQRLSGTAAQRFVKPQAQPELVYTAIDASGNPAVYVFNQADNGGIMMLSADDVAMPMLGYTDNGKFDKNNIPPVVEYWMGEYAREIEWAKSHGYKPMSENVAMNFPTSWQYVEPLVKTTWDQGAPYNWQTPTSGNYHMPTGCVATALAQIMNYWKYPEKGIGSITYSSNGQRLNMSFDRENFEWDLMLDTYSQGKYTTEQGNAVAYLMKACGYGSRMSYAMSASGTQAVFAGMALRTYFNYDGNVSYGERFEFSDSEWNELIYNQVSKVGPVLYSGLAPGGGHAFVIDGYDGNGYFHVNWGWSGSCNGFYLLSALNPAEQGTGGFEGGFNRGQNIVYNIQPPTGEAVQPTQMKFAMLGNLNATVKGTTLTFYLTGWNPPSYANISMSDLTPLIGIETTPADGSGSPIYQQCATSLALQGLPAGSFYSANPSIGNSVLPEAVFGNNYPDGKYKVRLVWKVNSASNQPWKNFVVPQGYNDYVYVTKSGGEITVESADVQRFDITAAEITTPLYYNNPCMIKLTISNPYDEELTQFIAPTLLIDGKINFQTDGILLSAMPKETVTKEMMFSFNRVSSGQTPTTTSPVEFVLGVYDSNYDISYGTYGTVEMKRSGTNFDFESELAITNAEEYGEVEGVGEVYGIDNPSAINLTIDLEMIGRNGFLATPLTAMIYEYDPATAQNGNLVYEKEFENMIFMASGDVSSASTSLKFTDFNPSKFYSVGVYYMYNNRRVKLDSVLFGASSGVDGVEADAAGLFVYNADGMIKVASAEGLRNVDLYDINGVRLLSAPAGGNTVAELSTAGLAHGLYIVYMADNKGNVKTLKIRI